MLPLPVNTQQEPPLCYQTTFTNTPTEYSIYYRGLPGIRDILVSKPHTLLAIKGHHRQKEWYKNSATTATLGWIIHNHSWAMVAVGVLKRGQSSGCTYTEHTSMGREMTIDAAYLFGFFLHPHHAVLCNAEQSGRQLVLAFHLFLRTSITLTTWDSPLSSHGRPETCV